MLNILLVALGGAGGSVLRYLAGIASVRLMGAGFPWGTLFVNVTGSFLIGVLSEVVARRFGASPELRLFLVTGILGGYTTFSAFSLDAAMLAEQGQFGAAALYVALSLVLSGLAVVAGLALMRAIV
ncbi:camphor resistance protein CrcB [Rhizobium sp. PP-F2F-G48]|uniref:fluoride efflux transporter CrcB n=1 Tax=Rhizobium sp. PP-F2F-G48 TaxID=2135651 RepID=UPI00105257C8|nr:fluoride efflux transporter CrcB [Rhizobium sp. PP-F2F-G48]TCM57422.1 camphor resistance protein CrcB [Rhizobium sp. PP-F2F-G48]